MMDSRRTAAYQVGRLEVLIEQMHKEGLVSDWAAVILADSADRIFDAMQEERKHKAEEASL